MTLAGVCSGEAVTHKILQPQMVSELFLVVALSMAITPFLASLGQRLGKAFEKSDMSVRPVLLRGWQVQGRAVQSISCC